MGHISELSPEAIEALLASSLVGRIACCDHTRAHRPYLVPIAYGYDGEAIYAISAPGRKIELMRRCADVSFEVDQADAVDSWQSVVAEGTYEELVSPDMQNHALSVLRAAGLQPETGPDTVVWRVKLTRKTGRCETP